MTKVHIQISWLLGSIQFAKTVYIQVQQDMG